MIYLNLNETKPVVATLRERTQMFNPYFIWKLTDTDTNQEYIFSQDDTSVAPWVYNQFTFSFVDSLGRPITFQDPNMLILIIVKNKSEIMY
jgi:hypothetical protein